MAIKRRNYTFALTEDNERIISIVEQFPCYAYIYHDKDEGVKPHYHYYIEFANPRYLNSVAEELGIPPNMIEPVRNKAGLLFYLCHETEAAKKQGKHIYDKSEIITNIPLSNFKSKLPMDDETYWLIVNTVDDYLENRISRYQMMKVLKPLF